MSEQTYPYGEQEPQATCQNCVHTIRDKGGDDIVVCVQHLQAIPGQPPMVCGLHSMKGKKADAP